MATFYVIGIGSKAQHGKDTVANFIKNKKKNVFIYHWADTIKSEVRNLERSVPLIKRCYYEDKKKMAYYILNGNNDVKFYWETDVPMLHELMNERNIDIYWGMNGNGFDEYKDGTMLQFWGTDYRRNLFDQLYWINKINTSLEMLYSFRFQKNGKENFYIVIPDTRFENEVENIKTMWTNKDNKTVGLYLNVTRYNKNGIDFFSDDRNPNHPSEIGLDGILSDYKIKNDGTLNQLDKKVDKFLNFLETME